PAPARAGGDGCRTRPLRARVAAVVGGRAGGAHGDGRAAHRRSARRARPIDGKARRALTVGREANVILSTAKDLMPVASGDEVLRFAQDDGQLASKKPYSSSMARR